MLLTKKIVSLALGVCIAGLVMGAQVTENIAALREKRQAIYREFGINSPIDILEEMCSLFARDPKNAGFWRKINAEIENHKLIISRYVDALLACVKAGDLEWPEEFDSIHLLSMTNAIIIIGLQQYLQDELTENLRNSQDPTETVDKFKSKINEVLRDRVAELIGKKLMAQCATQFGSKLKIYIAGVSCGSPNPQNNWVLRDEQQIICRCSRPTISEKIPVLRAERQAIYRKFCFDSPINVLEEACEMFAIDPKNIVFLNTINAEIRKLKGLFIRYANVLLTCVKAGDLEQPEEFFWAANWNLTNSWIVWKFDNLQKEMVEDIANGIDPTTTFYQARISLKEYLTTAVARLIGQKVIARCTTQIVKNS